MDAFDADVLIYASKVGDVVGTRVRALIVDETAPSVGSVLLWPEVIAKPLRDGNEREQKDLITLLARIDLRAVDVDTARAATALGAKYSLRAADSVHLATAVLAGADRFITNNRRDFPKEITEVEIVYPDEL